MYIPYDLYIYSAVRSVHTLHTVHTTHTVRSAHTVPYHTYSHIFSPMSDARIAAMK